MKYMNYFIESTKYNYNRQDYAELLGPEDRYSDALRKKLISVNTKNIYKAIQKGTEYIFGIELNQKKKQLIEWCSNRNISFENISLYLKTYVTFRTNMYKNMTASNMQFVYDIKSKLRINEIHTNKTDINKIIFCLLFGYPFNTCRKIPESTYYVSTYMPSLNNIYQIGSASLYKFKPIMLLDLFYTQNYLLYLNINIENNTISCLENISPEMLMLLDNIYTHKYFNDINNEYDYEKDKKRIVITSDITTNNANTVSLQNAIINVPNVLNIYIKDFYSTKEIKFKISDFL